MPGNKSQKKMTLIVAGNARSLIANRGDLVRNMRAAGLEVAAAVPTADYLPEVEELGITIYPVETSSFSTIKSKFKF